MSITRGVVAGSFFFLTCTLLHITAHIFLTFQQQPDLCVPISTDVNGFHAWEDGFILHFKEYSFNNLQLSWLICIFLTVQEKT